VCGARDSGELRVTQFGIEVLLKPRADRVMAAPPHRYCRYKRGNAVAAIEIAVARTGFMRRVAQFARK